MSTSGWCPESSGVSQYEKNYHYNTRTGVIWTGLRVYLAVSLAWRKVNQA